APRPSKEAKELSRLPKEYRSKWFRGIWDDIPPEKQDRHCAMFPEELPTRIIRMFSFAGETVLDPFVGSGTTMVAAQNWHRNSVGIELNHEFIPLIKSRVKNVILKGELISNWEKRENEPGSRENMA
ncbi:MAG TPA: site-specific DNA-methyltransferase, partial [Bacillota bacterium]|nr:site-specific DNA-methyltransferase [Bacillota bacterium]